MRRCPRISGFHRRRGERRRTVRGLRAFVHRRGDPQGKRQRRQERAVVEQRMMSRLSARGLFLRRFVRRTLPFLGRARRLLSPTRREANRARPRRRRGRLRACGAARGAAGAIGPDAGAAAGAVMACLHLGWRREARRALKRFLRLRDRQRGPAGLVLSASGRATAFSVLKTLWSGTIRSSAATFRAAASKLASARSSFDADRALRSASAASYASENSRLAAR